MNQEATGIQNLFLVAASREALHPLAPSENYSYKGSVHDDTPGDHLIEVRQTSKLYWV